MTPRALGRIVVGLLVLAVVAVFVAETPSHRRWLVVVTARQYLVTLLPVVAAAIVAAIGTLAGADRNRRHRATRITAAVAAVAPVAAFAGSATFGLFGGSADHTVAFVVMTLACLASVAAIRTFVRDLAAIVALSLPLAVALGVTCNAAAMTIWSVVVTDVEDPRDAPEPAPAQTSAASILVATSPQSRVFSQVPGTSGARR